jgi:hypothetical protein
MLGPYGMRVEKIKQKKKKKTKRRSYGSSERVLT